MAKNIIVISGKQFSGKDTFAKFLLEFLPNFRRIGIADSIKLEYGKLNNLTFEEIEKNKHLYRADLIELGNWGRAQDDNYWLNKIIEADGSVIVPDIRLPKELEIFKSHGAISMRIEAPRENRGTRGVLVKEDDPTETTLDGVKDWDYIVENGGTLEELREKAKQLAKELPQD